MWIWISLTLGFVLGLVIMLVLARYFNISFKSQLSKFVLPVIFAAVCLILYQEYSLSFIFLKYVVLIFILITIGIIDLKTTDVYLVLVLVGVIAGVILLTYEYLQGGNIYQYIYAAIFSALLFILILLLSNGVGWGDVEIIFVAGLFLGIKNTFYMVNIAIIIGALVSLYLIVTKKNKVRDVIPFVPCITISTIMVVLINCNNI